MIEQIGRRGTGNASLASAIEGLLVLAAAVEAVLVAGLALIVGKVGAGSATVAAFLRLNALLLRPVDILPGLGGLPAANGARQLAAVLGYGLVFAIMIGGVSWVDRQRALY